MPRSILIVEDDKNIADLIRLYLEKEGMTCHVAGDGLEGWRSSTPSSPTW